MKMHCHVFWMLIIVSKASYIFLWQLCPVCNRQVVGLRMSSLCTWRRKAFFKIHTINSFFSSFRFNSKNSLVSFFSIRMCVRLMSSKRRMQDYKKHWIALNIHTMILVYHSTRDLFFPSLPATSVQCVVSQWCCALLNILCVVCEIRNDFLHCRFVFRF